MHTIELLPQLMAATVVSHKLRRLEVRVEPDRARPHRLLSGLNKEVCLYSFAYGSGGKIRTRTLTLWLLDRSLTLPSLLLFACWYPLSK